MKKDRTELVVLIRPSVSVGPEDVYNVRDRNMKPMRMPVNLEDELILPDPAVSKSGRRSGVSSLPPPPQLKPFRANADTVQAADASGVREQSTPQPTPAEASEPASAAVAKQKKPSKSQAKNSAE